MRCLYEWIIAILTMILIFLTATFLASGAYAQDNRSKLEEVIIKEAKREGINPSLALAIAEVESGFNDKAVGKLKEVGVFQLRPKYHDVITGHTTHNIRVGVKFLATMRSECSSVYGDAWFVCFNYGPTRRIKHPKLFPYYKKVMKVMQARKERAHGQA